MGQWKACWPNLLLTGFIGACGGDASEPAVPTSLVVEPAQVSLAVGASVTLRARVLDQNGTALSSGAVIWTSSDTTRVTVDDEGVARGVRPGPATVTALSGSIRGEAQATVLAPALTVEAGRSASARLGTGGGVVEVQSSAGVRYSLVIPPAGLLDSATITLAPVGAIENSPFQGLLGALRMDPDGLRLLEPARLTITLPTAPANPGAMLGIHFSHDGSNYTYRPVQVSGRDVTLSIPHFSGAGAFNPPGNPPPPVSNPAHNYGAIIAVELHQAAAQGRAVDVAFLVTVFKEWYTLVVRPALLAITSPAVSIQDVYDALQTWREWLYAIDATGLGVALKSMLVTEIDDSRTLAVNSLRQLIDILNLRCVTDRNPFIAAKVLAVQYYAEASGLATPGSGLDEATVLRDICLSIDLSLHMPTSMPAGQPFDLEIRASAIFGGQIRDELLPLDITVDHRGTTTAQIEVVQWQGPTTTLQLTPSGDRSIDITADVCILEPINPPPMVDVTEICDYVTVTTGVDPYYTNDFQQGNPGTEWPLRPIKVSPSGERYLGDFTTEVVNLRLTGLPAHNQIRIEFDFHTISDWEGSAPPSDGGTDIVVFALDGGVLRQTTFSTKPGFPQAWPESYPGPSNFTAMSGAAALNRLGYPGGSGHTGDATYSISFTAQHSQPEMTFAINATLDTTDPTTGERWGLDNIRVFLIQ